MFRQTTRRRSASREQQRSSRFSMALALSISDDKITRSSCTKLLTIRSTRAEGWQIFARTRHFGPFPRGLAQARVMGRECSCAAASCTGHYLYVRGLERFSRLDGSRIWGKCGCVLACRRDWSLQFLEPIHASCGVFVENPFWTFLSCQNWFWYFHSCQF